MNYRVSSRHGGMFHIYAAVGIFTALMLAGHYGESMDSRINGQTLPARSSASPDLVANCVVPPRDAGVATTGCSGSTQSAGLTDIALTSAETRD